MSEKKINVAIVGLGFGAEFIPIYQRHPNANMYAICQRTREKLDQVGGQYGVEKRFTSFEELLKDPKVDAVHINSPIHLHAPQSIAALKAGKKIDYVGATGIIAWNQYHNSTGGFEVTGYQTNGSTPLVGTITAGQIEALTK